MDAAAVSSSSTAAAPGRRRLRAMLPAAAITLVLLVSFLLRLWGIKQGLPYSYNSDEATHFVPRAVAFTTHDLNPHYFLNPPAYSYLLYVVFELWLGSADAVARTYAVDPTAMFVLARVVASVLGTVAVWLTYLAGVRLFDRKVALLAAAIFGVAFLPIFYSHFALNDVPTLAPVALSLYGAAGIIRYGRRRDYLIAGIAAGLAAATKYTGGIGLLCLLAASVSDGMGGAWRVAVRRLALGLVAALAAFVLANPYALLDFSAFTSGLSQQASQAAGENVPEKLGITSGSGIAYYVWTFTWGFGWLPSLAAIVGSALLLIRRRFGLALLLLPAPIVFVIVMGEQQRFFGRWLMPIFPIVALLAAYGATELARRLARAERIPAPLAYGLVAVVLLAQSAVAVIHDDAVLSRPDTRNLLRAWMVAHVPAGAKVVIEPIVPDDWATDVGRSLAATPTGERWSRYPTWLSNVDDQGRLLPNHEVRYVVVDEYERTLRPALLGQYVVRGYCWVVTGGLQAGRAFSQPQAVPGALAYYGQLARQGRIAYTISPFAGGAHPVPFGFDWSIDYYPRQFRLPGPEVSVYRLYGGECGAAP